MSLSEDLKASTSNPDRLLEILAKQIDDLSAQVDGLISAPPAGGGDHINDASLISRTGYSTVNGASLGVKTGWVAHGSRHIITRIVLTVIGTIAFPTQADITQPIFTFKTRPVVGNPGGEATITTITIPDAAAVGEGFYKDITPLTLDPGEELVVDVTTAAADSSSPRANLYFSVEGHRSEVQLPLARMTESA